MFRSIGCKMELRTSGPRSNFLGCLGGAFDECGCCCGLSLKQGIFIIGIIDIVFGLLSLFILVAFFRPGADEPEAWVAFVNMLYSIVRGGFAVLGINGVIQLKVNWLTYYLYVALAYIPLRLIDLLFAVAIFDVIVDGSERLWRVLDVFIAISITLYLSKVIWSTIKRLENNEAILVMHGRGAAQLMQQQSNSLAVQPGFYAAPGQPVPQYELK